VTAPAPAPPHPTGAVAATIAVLAIRNAGEARVPPTAYVPVNVAVGAVLVALARASGSTRGSLGFGRRHLGRSLRTGGAAAITAAAVLAAAGVQPATRPLFHDERVRVAAGPGELARQVLWRIPVGTVAFEELAFRAVLLDLLRRRHGTVPAVALDSALFGLWHIAPTLATASANGIGGWRRSAAAAGSVLVTAVGGAAFCALRLGTGHTAAPALAHLALNDTAYALSWHLRSTDGRLAGDRGRGARGGRG
jgi:uncharacterized protein